MGARGTAESKDTAEVSVVKCVWRVCSVNLLDYCELRRIRLIFCRISQLGSQSLNSLVDIDIILRHA